MILSKRRYCGRKCGKYKSDVAYDWYIDEICGCYFICRRISTRFNKSSIVEALTKLKDLAKKPVSTHIEWWRLGLEVLSVLLALYEGPPFTGWVRRASFYILNFSLNKFLQQSSCQWFELPWRSCDVTLKFSVDVIGFRATTIFI